MVGFHNIVYTFDNMGRKINKEVFTKRRIIYTSAVEVKIKYWKQKYNEKRIRLIFFLSLYINFYSRAYTRFMI